MSKDDSPEAPPQRRSPRPSLLDRLLDPDVDLDRAFDRLLDANLGGRPSREAVGALRSVVPGDALASSDVTLAVLLTSVLARYEDIDRLLDNLREHDAAPLVGDPSRQAVAVVSEEELGDPEALSRALAPFDSDRRRFERLFDAALTDLDHLDVYQLSRLPGAELVEHMRDEDNLRVVQSLVGFLRTLRIAARTFEAMELPEPHIRDYLIHLYRMRDWNEMARLVSVLELAESQLSEPGADAGLPQEAT